MVVSDSDRVTEVDTDDTASVARYRTSNSLSGSCKVIDVTYNAVLVYSDRI